MSLTQDEKNEIRRENPTYPRVSRTTDPMVVRIDKTSLLVNDTMFTAKLKCGLGYKGYLIYSSGLGTPIYEKAAKTTDEWKKSFSTVGNRPYNIAFDSENTSQLTNVLTAAAKEWLDDLEIAIADRENDNAIKKAIDRLCWQLHYDITESHTNFPEVFKDNDFANVQIDRYPMETEYWDGTTLKTAISDIAGLEFNGGQPRSYEITYNGYLYESAERIKSFDNHLTLGSYSDSQGAITTFDNHLTLGSRDNNKGAIKTFDDHLMLGLHNDTKGAITLFDEHLLKNSYDGGGDGAFKKFDDHLTLGSYNKSQGAIKTFDDHLLKDYYDTINDDSFDVTSGAFKKFNDALNGTDANKEGSLIKIGTKLVPDDTSYYSISECLRDKQQGTYSIARSLREDNQSSVSQATHDQTVLESTHFTDIEGRIGDTSFGEGAVSLVQRIGIFNCGDTRRSLFDTFGGDNGYANKANVRISDVLGVNTNVGTSTVAGLTRSVYNLMQPSAYGGSGFVALQDNKAYVRTSAW